MNDISVIIPTYNRAGSLFKAIESATNQTVAPAEIIVVDDASTDQTEQVISNYKDSRITYIRHDYNQGGAAARNTGFRASVGDYIAFLDSDDQWKPQKLEKQVSLLESLPSKFVASYCDVEREKSGITGKIRELLANTRLNYRETGHEGGRELIGSILMTEFELGGTSTLLVKRDAIDKIDGFDESFPRHQDWEFLIRLLDVGNIAYVDQPLVRKIDTGDSDLETTLKAKKQYFEKFNHLINKTEQDGHNVHGEHYRHLAKIALKEGKYTCSIQFLRQANFRSIGQVIEIGYAAARGLKILDK